MKYKKYYDQYSRMIDYKLAWGLDPDDLNQDRDDQVNPIQQCKMILMLRNNKANPLDLLLCVTHA